MVSRAQHYDSQIKDMEPIKGRVPLVLGEQSFHDITETVCAPLEWKPPIG